MQKYLYLAPPTNGFYSCVFTDDRLADLTERHKIQLNFPPLQALTDLFQEVEHHKEVDGVIIGLERGWLGWLHLNLASKILKNKQQLYLYWPLEAAVEVVNQERLQSYWYHFVIIKLFTVVYALKNKLRFLIKGAKSILREYYRLARSIYRQQSYTYLPAKEAESQELSLVKSYLDQLQAIIDRAEPVLFNDLTEPVNSDNPLPGCGIYLRTDFWAKIQSGGSYGHTCYVAKELAAVTENLICFMPHRYLLLDELKLHQVVLEPPGETGTEDNILRGAAHYESLLKIPVEVLKPAYIYERLCLGNYTGVLLSQQFNIPYIVEYNGSEISMKRTFEGSAYQYEEIYLKAEEAAFRQATFISVVSEPVKEDLIKRGVKPSKILVNPNGADVDTYAPLPAEQKRLLRQELGFNDSHCVIGFIGTFGGWHGIDVLAEAIPQICQQLPEVRFLLIGDGNYKHLIDHQVTQHQLANRVISMGRVPQQEGVRLLGACDIYVSPHNSHMIDSRFFGSPTKIFEYMAMGGGIVASDLEQIGKVLSPALRLERRQKASTPTHAQELALTDEERFPSASCLLPSALQGESLVDERAVLCTPGDVEEFVTAVVELAKQPDIYHLLGKNARQAVLDHYSWKQHVASLWHFYQNAIASEQSTSASIPTVPLSQMEQVASNDAYKNQTQQQWNNDPCGSHYVQQSQQHTLEWFLEAKNYRYQEYAPWMSKVMEFANHAEEKVLEIGGGMGTDLSQFALHGAQVTDIDLSSGHLALAQENFNLQGLSGEFIHHDAEELPFEDNYFDLIYSNGVIHHTPNTVEMVREIYRTLKPGGKVIIMVYAENSLHYWRNLVKDIGLDQGELYDASMGEIMSRHVEISENNAKPLVKVYTKKRIKQIFKDFTNIKIVQRQLTAAELPRALRWLPLEFTSQWVGWNLILKARKPEDSKSG
ncbi:MAG: methyltransferase domain-containing protein [Symploca sp. SIO2C1]|nr:methyltransferase domain-containing protein [Symploca sp. SIO2C1]